MICTLCAKDVDKYDPAFNRLRISEEISVDICSDCITKFIAWQGENAARLFPTRVMKKMYGK